MTNDWLAPDALVVPVDYATYCAAEVARDAALFLVDQREQFLANRDAGLLRRLPGPDGDARRGDRRAARRGRQRPGRRDPPRRRPGRPRLRRRDRRRAADARARDRPAALTRARAAVGQTDGRSGGGGRRGVASSGGSLRILLVLVVVVAGVVTGIVGVVTLRALPQTDGAIQVDGPRRRRVTVLRDAHGHRPDPRPTTPHDLFLAQGYVHAQERMWQMEVWRHISAGRLSELFGKSTLDQDRFIRTLGWRAGRASATSTRCPPERGPSVDAYADGVNAWIDRARRARSRLPFVVTGLQTGTGGDRRLRRSSRGRALDTAAWQKVQAWQLGGNFDTEIFRMLADAQLGDPARTDELFPAYRPDDAGDHADAAATARAAPARRATARGGRGARRAARARRAITAATRPPRWRDVAATRRRRSSRLAGLDGGDGIAGDHRSARTTGSSAPSKSASGRRAPRQRPAPRHRDAVGLVHERAALPEGRRRPARTTSSASRSRACPAVVLGHNARIAWGATNVDPDVQDLFLETVDPANPDNYLFRGESVPFDGPPRDDQGRRRRRRRARRPRRRATGRSSTTSTSGSRTAPLAGPALDGDGRGRRHARGDLQAQHRRRTSRSSGPRSTATARRARTSSTPTSTATSATSCPGRIPIRADPRDRGDRDPVAAATATHEWTGYIPFDGAAVAARPAERA